MEREIYTNKKYIKVLDIDIILRAKENYVDALQED